MFAALFVVVFPVLHFTKRTGNARRFCGHDAFANCGIYFDVIFAKSKYFRKKYVSVRNNVTNIPAYAFHGCSSLTEVTIPNSVTSIGYNAFAYCSGLTKVTIGNSVTRIGSCALLWALRKIKKETT